MDKIRKQILLTLETNSRIDLSELAVLLGTDEVTIANEVAAMEKEHIICGYHTLIDWDRAANPSSTPSSRCASPPRGIRALTR